VIASIGGSVRYSRLPVICKRGWGRPGKSRLEAPYQQQHGRPRLDAISQRGPFPPESLSQGRKIVVQALRSA
jgi:hypothetical protein